MRTVIQTAIGAAALLALACAPALADTRALVVGADYRNAEYVDLRLRNTLNDIDLVSTAIDNLPHAHSAKLDNPSAGQLARSLDEFVGSLAKDDVALFYFAGHGLQVRGSNFFLMSDGRSAVPVDAVLDRLLARPADRAGPVVFIIDACRSSGLENARQFDSDYRIFVNDLGASGAPSSITLQDISYSAQGLVQVNRARGLNAVVLFSTEPGNLALDGQACAPGQAPADFRRKRNRGDLDDDLRACGFSPFARAIFYEIDRRASFDDVARRISNRVSCETARFDEGNADNCASARVARRVSRDATTVARFRQSPWRQGDVGFPIYLAGEPRFPVP